MDIGLLRYSLGGVSRQLSLAGRRRLTWPRDGAVPFADIESRLPSRRLESYTRAKDGGTRVFGIRIQNFIAFPLPSISPSLPRLPLSTVQTPVKVYTPRHWCDDDVNRENDQRFATRGNQKASYLFFANFVDFRSTRGYLENRQAYCKTFSFCRTRRRDGISGSSHGTWYLEAKGSSRERVLVIYLESIA